MLLGLLSLTRPIQSVLSSAIEDVDEQNRHSGALHMLALTPARSKPKAGMDAVFVLRLRIRRLESYESCVCFASSGYIMSMIDGIDAIDTRRYGSIQLCLYT